MFTDIPSYQVEEVSLSKQDWEALEEKAEHPNDTQNSSATDENL